MNLSIMNHPKSHLFLDRNAPWFMPITALLMVQVVAVALKAAFSWPFVHDAPLIHYVIFLMANGRAPYRDIVEMNMPGTYILEWIGMHVFGPGAFGWWLWDAFSGMTAIAASAWIAGKKRRGAGIAGGAVAYLFHLRDGPCNLGQRDWIVAVLLLVAVGFLFTSIRTLRPEWMAGSMATFGCAASIKPPALAVGIFLFCIGYWIICKNLQPFKPKLGSFILWAFLGGLAPAIVCATFLLRWGITHDFFVTLHTLVPYYASLQRQHFGTLFVGTLVLKPILGSAFVVFLLEKSWRHWESVLLAAGALAGASLFIVQGKGWSYHLYPEVAFITLWAMLEVDRGLHSNHRQRLAAVATLLVTLLIWTPINLKAERESEYPETTLLHLEKDLNELGGSDLSGKIQCLDMTMGSCINVLYRMHLVQSTGFIYDFYLFPKKPEAVTSDLQARFVKEVTSTPPELFILSSQTWPGDSYGYEQIANWPKFKDFLEQKYSLVRELPQPPGSAGYRIYKLDDGTRNPFKPVNISSFYHNNERVAQ